MSKKVLVVEDNQDNREIILEFLSAYGFDVVAAEDGKRGIEMFKVEHPDIVLSDVLLPKVNGFGVCQAIKTESPGTPVVLMSALYKTFSVQAEAKQKYGADEYLLKPLNLVEMADKLCNLLGVTKENLKTKKSDSLAVPDKGDFKEHPPVVVFGFLLRKQWTGVLTVTGPKKKNVYIREGMPIYLTSDDPKETYPQLMVKDGLMTAEELAENEKAAKSNNMPVSKVLLTKKVVDKNQVSSYMVKEVNVRLADLLRWKEGEYRFAKDDSFLEKIKRPDLALYKILYQSLRQGHVNDYILSRYEQLKNSTVAKSEDRLPLVADIDMELEDLETFALIDGERTVAQVLSESPGNPEDVLRVVFTLDLLGIVSVR